MLKLRQKHQLQLDSIQSLCTQHLQQQQQHYEKLQTVQDTRTLQIYDQMRQQYEQLLQLHVEQQQTLQQEFDNKLITFLSTHISMKDHQRAMLELNAAHAVAIENYKLARETAFRDKQKQLENDCLTEKERWRQETMETRQKDYQTILALETTRSQYVAQLNHQNQVLEKMHKQLEQEKQQRQIQEMKLREATKQIHILKGTDEKQSARVRELTCKLNQVKEKKSALKTEVMDHRVAVAQMEQRIAAEVSVLEQAHAEKEKAQQEIVADLKRQVATLEGTKELLRQQTQALETLQEDYKELEHTRKKEREEYVVEINELKDCNSMNESTSSGLKEKMKELKKANKDLKHRFETESMYEKKTALEWAQKFKSIDVELKDAKQQLEHMERTTDELKNELKIERKLLAKSRH